MLGTGEECLAGRGTDEAVAADGLGGCGGLEEEGELAVGARVTVAGSTSAGMSQVVRVYLPRSNLQIDGRGRQELGGDGGT